MRPFPKVGLSNLLTNREQVSEMKNGEYTAEFGEELTEELEPYTNFQVYYDHGDKSEPNVGHITPYFRDKEYNGSTTLSNVDILITRKTDDVEKPIIIIEIEEAPSSPKKILGDIFNLFFAGSVRFRLNNNEGKDFQLNKTHLIVGTVVKSDNALRKIDNISREIIEFKRLIKGSVFDVGIGEIGLFKSYDIIDLRTQIKKNVLQTIRYARK